MTNRGKAAPKPVEVPDPLADLRDPDPSPGPLTAGPGEVTTELQVGPDRLWVESAPLATQEDWDAARGVMIAGWHEDTVAVGFLHKGGRCGCHYLAGVALTAVMPVQDDDQPETDPEPGADTPED